ncbi:GNAT family N-acetyltransferase [Streptomyces sp. HNM0574]|uniref:GNAT family N-acetyltransferase n=1 Tax=Streptomyces sp. HNM0574 TaxID=2714954 RepID=UPI00146E6B38|nr:GNAT family N-acetyltransferase [Streptomyces sp. HNM0574]NLU65775.1 GNAT family N-acetyltransferase [Streptomyces sp. HNM0574]
MTGFTVSPAQATADWGQVTEWADAEGWNVGRGDADAFLPTDPGGFLLGRLDGRTVSAVSVVNYSPRYAFLGHYITEPALRGKGFGYATWQAALAHAGGRTVGLDAVPAQVGNYRASGFEPLYGNARYTGRPHRPATTLTESALPGTAPLSPDHLDALTAYDQGYFPAERGAFLRRWLTGPGRVTHVRERGSRITGYGSLRPSTLGFRLGPLFAETPEDAESLLDALLAHLGPDDEVALDIPDPNGAAAALATARGLTPGFRTTRMYAGPPPATPTGRAWAVTTLELG